LILWRVSNYATLDGSGGFVASGRWHSKGRPVIYCSLNPSTALLETLVHMEIDAEDRPDRFQMLKIQGLDKLSREQVEVPKLTLNWQKNLRVTQRVGDQWLAAGRTLLLEVPSILVPETWNVLINPLHGEVAKLKIAARYQHPFDARFFE
jgi:RES domain-containing protein